jgi:crotonobetainyl-CoA:carnitine CoA-transferase CaiB-like acyl-CoA transferase
MTQSTDEVSSPGLLSGLSVVECGEGVAASFATKLMADLGADVIKVEPLAGDWTRRYGPFPGNTPDPEKSGLFIYLNSNKRGVTLDLSTETDRDTLHSLLAKADLLVHNVAPSRRDGLGLASANLGADFPHLVIAAISPFGDRGPYRNWNAYELNVVNAGGWAFLSPGASEFPALPPLKAFGHQGDYQGGLHACFAALGAYFHRLESGKGQTVEVSQQECVAAMLEMNLMHYSYAGRETSRLGTRVLGPWKIMETADGFVLAACVEEDQWRRLVELMGDPEWAHEEIFQDRLARGRNADALYALMQEWISGWKTQDLYHEAQRRRIPFAAVNSMKDLYANSHLAERGFFVEVNQPGLGSIKMPGAPSRYASGWSMRTPAPRLGQHNAELLDEKKSARVFASQSSRAAPSVARRESPLSGIRVLDFTWAWAGPYCTMQLAHLGAEVIRIETEKRICVTRGLPPFADDVPGPNRAGYYNQYNQGKRSITMDLSRPEAIEIALEMARHCDVVTDNFAAGVMERLGLGYEKFRARRPDIVMLSMSGYGQTGPLKNYVSYGPPAAATAGFFSLSGYEGKGPSEIGISYADPNAGIFGAVAVMVALLHRKLTGRGQYIDQSQLETALALLPEGLLEYALNGRQPQRAGNRHRSMAPHNCYKTAGDDDKWVSIAVGTENEWRALCAAIGQPALAGDPRFQNAQARKENEDALDGIIARWTRTRDRWEVTRELQHAGVAAFPAMSNKDLATDEHLRERGYLVQMEHPVVGRRIHAGIPWTMSGTPCRIRHAAPLRGADTDPVLKELLGYSADEIGRLRAAGVLS